MFNKDWNNDSLGNQKYRTIKRTATQDRPSTHKLDRTASTAKWSTPQKKFEMPWADLLLQKELN